jgi:hypothetical protein
MPAQLLTPLLLSRLRLLMAEFVVDLLCTSRMSEAEYRENLSANSMKSLSERRPRGLRAPRLRADHREVKMVGIAASIWQW